MNKRIGYREKRIRAHVRFDSSIFDERRRKEKNVSYPSKEYLINE